MFHAPTVILAALTEADQPALLWYIIGGLVATSMFISNLLASAQSWATLRRSKDECVTRAELKTVHERVDNFMPMFFKEVGKMSGELKQLIVDNRTATEKQTDQMSLHVIGIIASNKEDADQHRHQVTEQLASIERSLGRVEGATEHPRKH